ncbi:hypothetical protein B0O99DRAFT_183771 [Bisporella sp. PMI_857]|nr:hypothetical protein B0O99DRAFT_183771 [Bisporella sp. PMI_857]
MEGLDLEHCKKLMSILYTFEPQLNTLHEPERVGSYWCQSLRALMPVVDQNTGKKLSPLEVVTLIMEAESVDKIASQILHNYHHEAAYSMKGIVDFKRGNVRQKKPTIEFRQHQGTLDGLGVRNWIKVVAGIVRYAKGVYLSQLYNLICKISPKSRFTVIDLLKEIGLHDSATYYQDRLYFVPEDRQSPVPELSFAQPQTYSYSGMDAFPRKSHATSPGDLSQDPEHAATFKRILTVANETEEQKRARLESMVEVCDPEQPTARKPPRRRPTSILKLWDSQYGRWKNP